MHIATSCSKISPRLIFIEKCTKNKRKKTKPLGYFIKLYLKNIGKIEDAQALDVCTLKKYKYFSTGIIITHKSKTNCKLNALYLSKATKDDENY